MLFTCRDPRGCARKAARWGIAQQAIVQFTQERSQWRRYRYDPYGHMLVRLRERGFSTQAVEWVLKKGALIEMQSHHPEGTRYLLNGSTRDGRPTHLVMSYAGTLVTVHTVYDPRSRPWQWADGFARRLHWCVKAHLPED